MPQQYNIFRFRAVDFSATLVRLTARLTARFSRFRAVGLQR